METKGTLSFAAFAAFSLSRSTTELSPSPHQRPSILFAPIKNTLRSSSLVRPSTQRLLEGCSVCLWWRRWVLPPRPIRLSSTSQITIYLYYIISVCLSRLFFHIHYEHSTNPQHNHFDDHGTPETHLHP